MTTVTVKTIEAIVKVTERCNINCTYCYMFNRGNDDYLRHSKRLSLETSLNVANALRRGVIELSAERVRIILHGGEPLMLATSELSEICQLFLDRLRDVAHVEFTLQTNAILVNEKWIDFLERFRVSVGVSLDGPESLNDAHRVDHKGKGTYAATICGLKRLQTAAAEGRISEPGLLVVINPKHDAKAILSHVRNDLAIKWVNFLMPMVSHDDEAEWSAEELGTYLRDLITEHAALNMQKVSLRLVDQFFRFLARGKPFEDSEQPEHKAFAQISFTTDGCMHPDDELKPLNLSSDDHHCKSLSVRDFLNSPLVSHLDDVQQNVPPGCQNCCWQNYCKGGVGVGSVIGRYSRSNGFNNISVHCEGLKLFYASLTKFAIANGISEQLVLSSLNWENSPNHTKLPTPPQSILNNSRFIQIRPFSEPVRNSFV
jgi:uncharacterized protein